MSPSQFTSADCSRAWVDIDLGALLRNARALARHARVPLLPMIKADAYGLGAVPVARALAAFDPFGFGVATVAEGRELRAAGIWRPVFVFTPLRPEDFAGVREAKLIPTLGDSASIAAWDAGGGGPWHLAIDTGMTRAGVRWDSVADLAEAVRRSPPEGAFTHFHSSEADDGSMALQERRFRDALAAVPAVPARLHTDNSAAIVRRPAGAFDAAFVRPGVFLYGVGSGPGAALIPEPVVHVRARIVDVHEMRAGETVGYGGTWTASAPARIATLAIGYADGYRRTLGNRGMALVHGMRAPVVGLVTMDMTMLDVSAIPCAPGDVVTLIGRDGEASITVEEVGAACDLSPYEILTGLRQRLPRRYA